jgi:protein SCO1/2
MNLSRVLPWIVVTAVLGALAGGIAARMLAQNPIALQAGTWLPQPRPLPPFQLTDVDGHSFANADLAAHPSLLFFGYTSCPDVCPATLAMVRELQRQSPLPGMRFLFVSVDPDRDTPAVLKHYLEGYDPHFVGLLASRAALAPLLSALSAEAERQALPGGDSRITHSAALYLLDSHGRLRAVYSPPLSASSLAADLRQIARANVL